jgi:hypothetical protein
MRGSMRGALLAAVLVLLAACGRDALPQRMTIEQVVAELAPPLPPGARVEGARLRVVRTLLQPGYTGGCGGKPRHRAVRPGESVSMSTCRDGLLFYQVEGTRAPSHSAGTASSV